MTKRIFRSICMVAMTVVLACMTIVMGSLYSYFSRIQNNQLKAQTMLAAQGVASNGLNYLTGLDLGDCRITWIDSEGNVLYDSACEPDEMENHLEREEVRKALAYGYGESARYSATLMNKAVYSAKLLPDGTVIRLSLEQYSPLTLLLGMAHPTCLVILVAVVLSLWLAHRLSKRIVQPLNDLHLDEPLAGEDYEELTPLLRRIDSQQRQLRGQAQELKRKQREFDTVTNNMTEGLVLMNDKCNVLTMNPAAARIMGLVRPYVGINFLTLNQASSMEGLLNTALEGSHAEADLRLSSGVYQIDASPVKSGGQVSGVALLMFDITQKQQAEAQRREFTANVSHELKTPLHAISGYAELMKGGLVRPQDTPNFAGKIYDETQRMIQLVDDILKLSRLDEGADGMKREEVDLYILAEEAVKALSASAQEAQVALSIEGDHCRIQGIPQLLTGIVTNLCTNAIKYNHPGGRAEVRVRDNGSTVTLTVDDTGIGIPPEHQERIFERFYRVDKSHSKAMGGTGLGLSIVKHAVIVHNAKLELHSTVGLGSTFSIHFPKENP